MLGIAVLGSLVSALLIAGAYEREKTQRVVAETNEARALTGEQLAKQQEELAKQQEALAKEQQKIAIQQKAEAERQRTSPSTAVTCRTCDWPETIAPQGIPIASFVFSMAKSPSPAVRTSAVGNGGNYSPSATPSDSRSRAKFARLPGAPTRNTWRPSRRTSV